MHDGKQIKKLSPKQNGSIGHLKEFSTSVNSMRENVRKDHFFEEIQYWTEGTNDEEKIKQNGWIIWFSNSKNAHYFTQTPQVLLLEHDQQG